MQINQTFRLSNKSGIGICCDENGSFFGDVPILERGCNLSSLQKWDVRAKGDINLGLRKCYGLPIEIVGKIGPLELVARALNRGDVAAAQMIVLHLQIPDPSRFEKSASASEAKLDLAKRLYASGLLKLDFDPAEHPRQRAKSPAGIGGQFAPVGAAGSTSPSASSGPVQSAQLTIPAPFDIPIPRLPDISPPAEMVRPQFIFPRGEPSRFSDNPYPKRPECVEEWASARKYCGDLERRGLLGKGDYAGMGGPFVRCLRGQVSESCGGNSVRA